jgi:tripeptidyl-peptidase-1
MRSQSILVALAVALNTVVALSGRSSLEVFESLHRVPQGWTRRGDPEPSTRIRLRIALSMPDHAKFEKTLYDISTPGHPTYGLHLNHEEVRSLVKPRDESADSILSWLQNSGVAQSDIIQDNEWINFYISVASAENMLNTTFSYFTQDNDRSQVQKIRTLKVSLPSNISPHISMIQPTTRFGQMKAHRKAPFQTEKYDKSKYKTASINSTGALDVTACNSTITPDCLRALYNVGNFSANPNVGNSLNFNRSI